MPDYVKKATKAKNKVRKLLVETGLPDEDVKRILKAVHEYANSLHIARFDAEAPIEP